MTDRLKKSLTLIGANIITGKLIPPTNSNTKVSGSFRLEFTRLVWGRNFVDGWDINVYRKDSKEWVGNIHIDENKEEVRIEG